MEPPPTVLSKAAGADARPQPEPPAEVGNQITAEILGPGTEPPGGVPSWSFDEALPDDLEDEEEHETPVTEEQPPGPADSSPSLDESGQRLVDESGNKTEEKSDEADGGQRVRKIGFDRLRPEPDVEPPVPIYRLKGTDYVAAKARELGHDLGPFKQKYTPNRRLTAVCNSCGMTAGVCYQVEEGWSQATAVENFTGDGLRARCRDRRPPENEPPEEDEFPSGLREPRRPRPSFGSGSAWLLPFLNELAGEDPIETLGTAQPNWITEVDAESIWVETLKSRRETSAPQPVPLIWVEQALETLLRQGYLGRDDLTGQQSHRSAFIFAVLAKVPGVEYESHPIRLRLKEETNESLEDQNLSPERTGTDRARLDPNLG